MASIVMDIICIWEEGGERGREGGERERDSGMRKSEYSVLVLTHLRNTSQKLYIHICNL